MSVFRCCLVIAASVNFAAFAFAEPTTATPPVPAAVDPTGTWLWSYSFNDNPAEFKLELRWDGKQLAGKYTAFKNTSDIEEATLVGDQIAFQSKRSFNGNVFVVKFRGKIETNDIRGQVGVDFGDGVREFDWHAKRVQPEDEIVCVWKLKVDTPQGMIEPQLTIASDHGRLSGQYVSPFGKRDAGELAFENGELSWVIASAAGDEFDFKVRYRGKVTGDKIAGETEFDLAGETGTAKFTGERQPISDAPAAAPTPAPATER